MKRMMVTRERSGRSGRRRGSQKPGTSMPGSLVAGCAKPGAAPKPIAIGNRPAAAARNRTWDVTRFRRKQQDTVISGRIRGWVELPWDVGSPSSVIDLFLAADQWR